MTVPLMYSTDLPIHRILGQLTDALRTHPLTLLTAEPGAGKTTQVPLALLHEPWLSPKKSSCWNPDD